MTLTPLITAPMVVQLHVFFALCAIASGPFALLRRRRDRLHKFLGYGWVTAMAGTALSSFFISANLGLGPFGPIQILSVIALWGLWSGVTAARQRQIVRHLQTMRSLYIWAMGVAGLLTFLPGRRMNSIFFEQTPLMGFLFMALALGAALIWLSRAMAAVAPSINRSDRAAT